MIEVVDKKFLQGNFLKNMLSRLHLSFLNQEDAKEII